MQCGGGRGIEMGSAFNIFICHMQVVDGEGQNWGDSYFWEININIKLT